MLLKTWKVPGEPLALSLQQEPENTGSDTSDGIRSSVTRMATVARGVNKFCSAKSFIIWAAGRRSHPHLVWVSHISRKNHNNSTMEDPYSGYSNL